MYTIKMTVWCGIVFGVETFTASRFFYKIHEDFSRELIKVLFRQNYWRHASWKIFFQLSLLIRKLENRSSPPEMFLRKGVPKICRKFTGEHLCRSVISIKLLALQFNEITLRHECSLVNLHSFQETNGGGVSFM